MTTRNGKIGEIRDMIDDLHSDGRFEVVKEIMGEIDRFNFAGVSDAEVLRIWMALSYLPK